MFGLTRREQRWKAEQQAAELLVGFASTVAPERRRAVAEAMADATELQRLRAENAELRTMLLRYRLEVPLGHQPHMMAHAGDVAPGRA